MARGINKITLIGNLGRDPEVRYMPNGNPVTSATLATTESWKNKETGEAVERTEWHRLVFFNRLAEIAGEYPKKGAKLYIEGSNRTRMYVDKEGVTRYVTEIVVRDMQMLGNKPASETVQEGFSSMDDAPMNNDELAHYEALAESMGHAEDPPFEDHISTGTHSAP